jgi:hypothetical protein
MVACATDIVLSSVQSNLKELDADSLVRPFPGGIEVRKLAIAAPRDIARREA